MESIYALYGRLYPKLGITAAPKPGMKVPFPPEPTGNQLIIHDCHVGGQDSFSFFYYYNYLLLLLLLLLLLPLLLR